MLQYQSDEPTAVLIKIDAWLRCSPQAFLENVGRRIGPGPGQIRQVA